MSPQIDSPFAQHQAQIAVSVVLPVMNEQDSLRALDRELRTSLASIGQACEIIYVDDYSRDGSSQVLSGIVAAARHHGIRTRVVTLRRQFGQTAALAAGIDLAEGNVVVMLDADGQNNPEDIPRLLTRMAEGFDVVSGWRSPRKDRFLTRRIPSIVANWLISKVCGLHLHDYGCTLKSYNASLLKEVRLYGDMHRYLPVFLARLGARVAELKVDHRPRIGGVSKYGGERVFKVLVDLVLIQFMTKFYTRPMHFFGRLGGLLLLACFVIVFFMFVFKFGWWRVIGIEYQASFISTPLPSLAASFLLGSISSFFFGILGEILIRIHHESSGFLAYGIQGVEDSHNMTR